MVHRLICVIYGFLTLFDKSIYLSVSVFQPRWQIQNISPPPKRVKFLNSGQNSTMIRRRRKRKLLRRSVNILSFFKQGFCFFKQFFTFLKWILGNSLDDSWKRCLSLVSRRGELHANGQPRAEETCVPLPDELRKKSTRYGYHGCQHIRQGKAISIINFNNNNFSLMHIYLYNQNWTVFQYMSKNEHL